jgi:hypothetical protein
MEVMTPVSRLAVVLACTLTVASMSDGTVRKVP